MAITIGGVKITSLDITQNKEDGTTKVSGKYELVSSTGKVLAKQGFNGYNEIVLVQSGETMKLIADLQASLQKDLNNTLGLGE